MANFNTQLINNIRLHSKADMFDPLGQIEQTDFSRKSSDAEDPVNITFLYPQKFGLRNDVSHLNSNRRWCALNDKPRLLSQTALRNNSSVG